MKRFQNNVIDKNINEAVAIAERLFMPSSPMLLELRVKNDFKYNSGSGEEIYQKVLNHQEPLPVFTYKPRWRFSKAIGYFDGKAMHINLYKLPLMSVVDIVANLCHEKLHHIGFGHGSNWKTKEKTKYSVNYYVSENMRKWL